MRALALAFLALSAACRGLEQVASTIELGYSTSEGSLDGVHGRSSFDSDGQAVWLSLRPLVFLEPPTRTLADPDLILAVNRLAEQRASSVGSIVFTNTSTQASEQKAEQATEQAMDQETQTTSETTGQDDSFHVSIFGKEIHVAGIGGIVLLLSALGLGAKKVAKKRKAKHAAREE